MKEQTTLDLFKMNDDALEKLNELDQAIDFNINQDQLYNEVELEREQSTRGYEENNTFNRIEYDEFDIKEKEKQEPFIFSNSIDKLSQTDEKQINTNMEDAFKNIEEQKMDEKQINTNMEDALKNIEEQKMDEKQINTNIEDAFKNIEEQKMDEKQINTNIEDAFKNIEEQKMDEKQINTNIEDALKNMRIIEEQKTDEILMPIDKESEIVDVDQFGKVHIVVIGIGSAGCNSINRMYDVHKKDIKLIAIDTSVQTLENIAADKKLLIGENEFSGHGSGGNIELVEKAFDDAKIKIQSLLNGVDMLFLAGGFGRGTGSVGLYRVGNIAREMGILTIGFASIPRALEGNWDVCNMYYPKFIDSVDSTVLVKSEKIAEVAKELPISKAMAIADSMLVDGIRGVFELITKPGKINLDYADIKTAFKNKGAAIMGIGYGRGEDAVIKAITEALHSDIIEIDNVKNAQTIIFNIACPPRTITIEEATRGTELIYSLDSENSIQQLFFGYSYDNNLDDEVKVTFIATGTKQENLESNISKPIVKFENSKLNSSTKPFSFQTNNNIASELEGVSLFEKKDNQKVIQNNQKAIQNNHVKVEEKKTKKDIIPDFFRR